MDKPLDNDAIQVEVDIELASVVPEFLDCRKNECALLERLLEKGAFKEIESLGHRLKGTGGSFGFAEISNIGESLEHAAVLSDRASVALASRMLHRYLERVIVKYV